MILLILIAGIAVALYYSYQGKEKREETYEESPYVENFLKKED